MTVAGLFMSFLVFSPKTLLRGTEPSISGGNGSALWAFKDDVSGGV